LIGRLPEEIQGPLKIMNSAESAVVEFDEIRATKTLLEKK
jgi:hypothetical protein